MWCKIPRNLMESGRGRQSCFHAPEEEDGSLAQTFYMYLLSASYEPDPMQTARDCESPVCSQGKLRRAKETTSTVPLVNI